jgi:hypothetical protein
MLPGDEPTRRSPNAYAFSLAVPSPHHWARQHQAFDLVAGRLGLAGSQPRPYVAFHLVASVPGCNC